MYRILGLPPAETRRSRTELFAHVHPGDRERIQGLVAAVIERPEEVPEEGIAYGVRVVRGDGSVRELRGLGRVDRDEQGRPSRWIGAVQDVTEQRLAERGLRARHEVSEALREWETFERGGVDLLRRIAGALGYPTASLWLWDAGADALVRRASWVAPEADASRCEQADPGPERAWRSGEPVVTASAVAFPAVGPDGPLAVLVLASAEPDAPGDGLLRTLTAIGRELGQFLSRRGAELGPRLLTEREVEVLALAAEGMSGAAIAERLVLSPATVKTHFEHIYEKLGVGDRAAAVAQGLRRGLIR
jgi:DNA-binding CsgD family transcriptional regulator